MDEDKLSFIDRVVGWLMRGENNAIQEMAKDSLHLDGVYKGKSMAIHRAVKVAYLRGARRGAGCAWESKQAVHVPGSPVPLTTDELKSKLRKTFAELNYATGCGCCGDPEGYDKASTELAKLIEMELYEDGSGPNFPKYRDS